MADGGNGENGENQQEEIPPEPPSAPPEIIELGEKRKLPPADPDIITKMSPPSEEAEEES